MRRGSWFVVGVVVAGMMTILAPAQATPILASEVQTLPKHDQQQGYPHTIVAASPQYVLHNVHDYPKFGHDFFSVVRISDGTTVWSGFDRSADAAAVALAGKYYVEKVGDSTYWPDVVRFFDVETHAVAGTISVPDVESVFAIGSGWILTSRLNDGGSGYHLVVRRLNGSTSDLSGVATTSLPSSVGGEGDVAFVRTDPFTLLKVDVEAGTTSTASRPAGISVWNGILVGPTTIFDIHGNGASDWTVTRIDRATGVVTTSDVDGNIPGNSPILIVRGDGLGAYQPGGPITGALRSVDLAAGTVGGIVASNLSDYRVLGNGTTALMVSDVAPGSIALDTGSGPSKVTDLPPVSETTGHLDFDGVLRATWEDRTRWSINPDAPSPTWTQENPMPGQLTVVSGGVTLANDLDDSNDPTDQWHLYWPGGTRDITGYGLSLGHGGTLVVRQNAAQPTGFVVERVTNGAVVATVPGDRRPVADGSWVWSWAGTQVLTGTDVDHPGTTRTVPIAVDGVENPAIADVRGRFVMVAGSAYTVVDTLKQVPQFPLPGSANYTGGAPGPPALGNGFATWSRWTYTPGLSFPTGKLRIVADLSAAHNSREVVDPIDGEMPSIVRVDEAGSPAFAYVDLNGQPKIAHLPWLAPAPTPPTPPVDTSAPTLGASSGSSRFVANGPISYGWNATDAGGIASYDVQMQSAGHASGMGSWTNVLLGTTTTFLQQASGAGSERCFRFRARDTEGNVSGWSTARCSAVAIQDRLLARSTGAVRVANSIALDKSVTQLRVTGASVKSTRSLPGRTLAIWLIVAPNQGRFAVYVGSTRVTTISAASPTARRRLVQLNLPRGGVVKLVRIGSKRVSIDAIAIGR